MKNFPFLQRDLLSEDIFISYCEDRGIKINKRLLEIWNKQGILYPCVRVKPVVDDILKKVKFRNGEEKYVYEIDLSEGKHEEVEEIYNENYYKLTGFSYGRDDALEDYLDNGLVEYPVNDEEFIPWKEYQFAWESFVTNPSEYDNCVRLLYSKKQIYLVKHILDWRTYRMDFHVPPSNEILPELIKKIEKWLNSFDLSFKEKKYDDYMSFFEFINKLEIAKKNAANQSINALKEDDKNFKLDSKKNLKEYAKEYESKNEVLLQDLGKEIDCEWLNNWRENVLHLGAPSHEDFSFYKLIETKDKISDFQSRGKVRFMLDCFDIVHLIEHFLKIVKFTKFVSVEKLHWGVDSIKYCDICGLSFIPNKYVGNRAKACPDCKNKHDNKLKREGRKLGKYKR